MAIKTLARAVCTVTLLVAPVWTGCALNSSRVSAGRPVDAAALASITPDITTLSEVLTALGPPDYIIDGSQRLLDEEAFFASFSLSGRYNFRTKELAATPISTRILTAPEGEVILIYPATAVTGRVVGGAALKTESAAGRSGDLLVFVSKKGRIVARVVHSDPGEKSNR